MEQINQIEQFIQLLPKEYRQEARTFQLSTTDPWIENLRQYLSAVMGHLGMSPIQPKNDWDKLARAYMAGEDVEYHVSYWSAKNMSAGMTVRALNIQHAIDIVTARAARAEDQIIYVWCKESEFDHGVQLEIMFDEKEIRESIDRMSRS